MSALLIKQAQELRDNGLSYAKIGEHLGICTTKAHRLLKMRKAATRRNRESVRGRLTRKLVRSEIEIGPLCLDHCHKTGKFRA